MSVNSNLEIRAQYLEWIMTPPAEREPQYKKDIAKKLGVNRSTLYKWENETDFQEQLRELKTKWGLRWHGEILGRLMKIVTEGADSQSIQAAKILLQHWDLSPIDVESKDMSPKKVMELAEWLNEKGYSTINE